jgi:hypothetical protein
MSIKLVHTTRFWNNFHQVLSKQTNLKVFGDQENQKA